jgi:ribosomal protein S18 acetylase RimI-like enzyme
MEILDLRLLRPSDLQPLLEEEKQVWMESLRWDYSATASMVSRYLQGRALTGYAAVEDGRAVAYSFYICEGHKGLIGDAFVSRRFRDGITETRLLTHLVETLLATPTVRRVEAQLIQMGTASVREFFRSQGFATYDRKFLLLELAPKNAPGGKALARNVILKDWEGRWFSNAADLITRAYRGHIDSRISDQYLSRAGAERFLENIIQYPGCGTFDPAASHLAFSAESHLCGMILTSIVSDRVAHITQLCVAPDLHGQGIGRYLLLHCLESLRQRGFQAVTLTVTAANGRAVKLYEKTGFSALAGFPAFAWDAPALLSHTTERREAARS